MRSLDQVKQQIFAVVNGGCLLASAACGGSVISQSDGTDAGGTDDRRSSGTGGATQTASAESGTGGDAIGSGTAGSGGAGAVGQGGGFGGTGGMTGTGSCAEPHDAGIEPTCSAVDGYHACFSRDALIQLLSNAPDSSWKPPSCGKALQTCPDALLLPSKPYCGSFVYGFGTLTGDQCCYSAPRAVDGRPFVIGDEIRLAQATRRGEWIRAPLSDAEDLAAVVRTHLAQAWLSDALAEHASIATFARLTLQLLSLGAPPHLVAASQEAASDEIEHARACFALASRYAGVALGPSVLSIDRALTSITFTDLAVAAVHEGCVGETLAAVFAAERAERATDPVVRATLQKIAADETKHAQLAWHTVIWAIDEGGTAVARAAKTAFKESLLARDRSAPPPELRDAVLESHGRLSAQNMWQVERAVMREIILPLVSALEAGDHFASPASAA